jgi:hypothetical protein
LDAERRAEDARLVATDSPPAAADDGKQNAPERAFFEADDEARTRDPQLGKLMLYQLSYVRVQRLV